jgi:CheY-like chemotaxis protein
MKPTNPPRILLVEDDPVSRAFLVAAVEALPAAGVAAADCAPARGLASQYPG